MGKQVEGPMGHCNRSQGRDGRPLEVLSTKCDLSSRGFLGLSFRPISQKIDRQMWRYSDTEMWRPEQNTSEETTASREGCREDSGLD